MFGHKKEQPIIVDSTIAETRQERLAREQAEFNARQEQETAKWNMKQRDILRENQEESRQQNDARWRKLCEKHNL